MTPISKLMLEFVWKLLVFTAALAVLHFLLLEFASSTFELYVAAWKMYAFLVLLTLAGYLLVLLVHKKDSEKTGMAFIAIGFFKMLAAVLFLYPLISSGVGDILAQVLAFFVPYFFYLGFDTYFTIRLISKKQG